MIKLSKAKEENTDYILECHIVDIHLSKSDLQNLKKEIRDLEEGDHKND